MKHLLVQMRKKSSSKNIFQMSKKEIIKMNQKIVQLSKTLNNIVQISKNKIQMSINLF